MYQAVMLMGTEMATPQSRNTFGLQTRFRTIPGCVGIYSFFGEEHPVAEIEEIIVGGKTMSFDDYLESRLFDLTVELFYNNAIFEELYNFLSLSGLSISPLILEIHKSFRSMRGPLKTIHMDFLKETKELWSIK